ncbi:GIY-YIG nuclease family protein [Endozoicomonadaceae bacterium StTr2]
MEESQIVYILSNPAMPGIVKIGKTTQSDVKTRMNQLYTTGVPVPFECIYATQVGDCSKVESALHLAFGPCRVNPNREFFKIDAEQAIAILKLLGNKDVTPELNQELNNNISQAERDSGKKLNKRPNLNFLEMNIPDGSELIYKDGSVSVKVSGDKKVLFNGQLMSLTAATREVLGIDYSVQPTPHWTFKGKLLREIYNDTYSDDEDS